MLNVVVVRRLGPILAGVASLLIAGSLSAAAPETARTTAAAKKATGRKLATKKKEVAGVTAPRPIDASTFHLLIVRDPAMHRELNLTPEQIERVEEAIGEIDQPLFALRDVKEPESREKAARLLGQLAVKLSEILDDSQRQRLWEIMVQARGAEALLTPGVAKDLELSANQSRRIEEIFAGTKHAIEATSKKAVKGEKVSPAWPAELQTAGHKKVLAILSSRQNERLTALAGERFDLTNLRPLAYKAPALQGIDRWLNSEPLTIEGLRGKVVALNFFAYG